MKIQTTIARGRVAALIVCSLVTTVLPLSAVAEYGIPAGSGAVVTSGAPLLVRAAPGWDAAISYEIADGSYVTVWDVAQTAPDGSLWYPVDGGFVPVDAVTSAASMDGGFMLYQDAAPAETWTEPASEGWVDPATGLWVEPAAEGWVDPATGLWVDASADGWVDPATGLWVDANAETWTEPAEQAYTEPATGGWVDPATGAWVEPAAEGWVDPATGLWVDASTQQAVDTSVEPVLEGWVDPVTGQWVQPTAEGWVDPSTGLWIDSVTGMPAETAPANEVWLAQEAVVDEAAPVVEETWTEAPVEVAPVTEEWVEPVAEETWTEPVTQDTWTEAPVAEETWTDPNGTEWVEPAPVDTGGMGDAWSEPIATAYISGSSGQGAACRVAAERGSDKIAVLAEGEAVEVRGEAVGEWQPVNCAGMGGYVNTSLIAWEPGAVDDGGSRRGRNNSVGNGGVVTASGDGQSMASFAMQYVGYPYAYAGEGPYAFDCSGFTKFVAQNTLGMDITHDMFTQINMGQSVGMNELQPGDLVFFANTFRPGLSHVGIYIGGGQFVHAENESTGVVVSDLNSDYYGSRWAGGTRLA